MKEISMGDSQGKTNNTRYQRDGVVREKGMTGLKLEAGWVGVWVVKKEGHVTPGD